MSSMIIPDLDLVSCVAVCTFYLILLYHLVSLLPKLQQQQHIVKAFLKLLILVTGVFAAYSLTIVFLEAWLFFIKVSGFWVVFIVWAVMAIVVSIWALLDYITYDIFYPPGRKDM